MTARAQTNTAPTLPRAAVISDVSPEESVGGKRLLYRLLTSYDPTKLTVVEGDVWPTEPCLRLPDVNYSTIRYKPKYYGTRLHSLFTLLNTVRIRRYLDELRDRVEAHRAEAIITVAHGHLWLAAAQVARVCNLPLHLFIHDDWPSFTPVVAGFRFLLHSIFGNVYKQAASRFCISEFMEAKYRKSYSAQGTVFRPFRGLDSPKPRLRMRRRRPDAPLTVAFAGSIANVGYLAQLRDLATILERGGGSLELYTDISTGAIERAGLSRSNVRFCGFLSPSQLGERLGETADVLFVPASFASADSEHMKTLFPSKLVDYTALGIPILVWGPPYSAAVQWGLKSVGAVEIVTDPEPDSVATSLRRLALDPARAQRLAETALRVGNEEFCFEKALNVFQVSLLNASAIQ